MRNTEECVRFEGLVGPLVDGELPAAEAEAVETHLRSCPSCTRLAEDFRALDHLARRLEGPPPVAPREWEGVLARVRREPVRLRLGGRRRALDWLVPLLSLAALLLLTAWIAVHVARELPRLDPTAQEVFQEDAASPAAAPEGKESPGRKG